MKTIKEKIEKRIKELDKCGIEGFYTNQELKQVLTWIEESESPKTMSKEELLQKAIKDYPVGTKIRSARTNNVLTLKSEELRQFHDDHNIQIDSIFVYYEGKWAEIISKPEMKEPEEEIVSKQEKLALEYYESGKCNKYCLEQLFPNLFKPIFNSYQDVLDSYNNKEVYFLNTDNEVQESYPDCRRLDTDYFVTHQRAEQVKQLNKLLFIADTVCINPVQIYIKFTNESEGEVKRILGENNYNKALGI